MIKSQVIVAGGGPVGTFIAYCLAEYGIKTILLEAAGECETDMRASTFHPPTLSYLNKLGLANELIGQGLKAPIFQYRIRSTEEVLEFNLEELNEDLEFPYRLQCEQHKFARMFASKLENHENAEVLFNHEVISFDQENGSVNVNVKNFENTEEFKCDFFIGADGSNSIVRRNLGLEFSGFTYQEKFLTLSTTHDIQGYFNNLSYVNYVSDPKEWFVLLKAPSAWRMLVPVNEELDDEYIVSDEFIDKIFEKILKVSNKISTVHRTIYRVHQRVVDKMNHDRILLAGDSAHINNPLGGFGMNGGLHDAWNLAGKLDAIINSCANHNLLDLYDRQRRTIMNDFIQAQTIRNKRMIEETGDNNSTSEWNRMRDIHSDEEKRKEYMLRQSMTQSIKKQGEIV